LRCRTASPNRTNLDSFYSSRDEGTKTLKQENICNHGYKANRHYCARHVQQIGDRIVFIIVFHVSFP
jgi:hypothetical protein